MTNADIAELRGELVGLKVLLCNLLAFQAGNTDNPLGHLNALKGQSLAGIPEITDQRVRPAHLEQFRAAAAGLVLQAIEAASAVFPKASHDLGSNNEAACWNRYPHAPIFRQCQRANPSRPKIPTTPSNPAASSTWRGRSRRTRRQGRQIGHSIRSSAVSAR